MNKVHIVLNFHGQCIPEHYDVNQIKVKLEQF